MNRPHWGWEVGYDDRCEIFEGARIIFAVHPIPDHLSRANWSYLEQLIMGFNYNDPPLPSPDVAKTPWRCVHRPKELWRTIEDADGNALFTASPWGTGVSEEEDAKLANLIAGKMVHPNESVM